MQNNNYGLHENILLILEARAKHTGKSLDDVVAEYKKNIAEGKEEAERINLFIAMLRDVAEEEGKNPSEILEMCFKKAGLKMPEYIREKQKKERTL